MKTSLMIVLGLLALASVSDATAVSEASKPAEPEMTAAGEGTAEPGRAAAVEQTAEPERTGAGEGTAEPERAAAVEQTVEPERPTAVERTAEPERPAAVEGAAENERAGAPERVAEPERPTAVEGTAEGERGGRPEGGAETGRPSFPEIQPMPEGPIVPGRPVDPERQGAEPSRTQEGGEGASRRERGGRQIGFGGFGRSFPSFNLPEFGTKAPSGGVISTSLLDGDGASQIASGSTSASGNGQISTSKEDGGLSRLRGDQRIGAEGSGASRGQALINGAADLIDSKGGRSSTLGSGFAGFFTGPDGESAGNSATELDSFAGPRSSGGTIKSASDSRGVGGSLSRSSFSFGSQDPF